MRPRFDSLHLLLAVLTVLAVTACASIGRPEGGPRDERPPEYVRSVPAQGERNSDRTTINIWFNENVQLEDAFNKVMVSPAQETPPRVSSNGRRVTVHLSDTLVPGATYTIDFGDAIKDLNEGNVLDGFALDFSTGDSIDSLRISGMVLAAENLEPAQGFTVGAYANTADSAIRTLRPLRVARTNQYGQFTIRGLAPGSYRVYALNDVNRDGHWDRSEDVAFTDVLLAPSVTEIAVTDTFYASDGSDSLVSRPGVQYLPNDVLLSWFNQNYKAQYIVNNERPDRRRATVILGAPTDSVPEIRIVDGVADSALVGADAALWSVPQYSAHNDSVTLWIRDTVVQAADSLRLSVRYFREDSLGLPEAVVDTLRFYYRAPRGVKKKGEVPDTVAPGFDVMQLSARGSTQEVYAPLRLTVDQPVASIDTASLRLLMQVDTLWVEKPYTLEPDSLDPVLGLCVSYPWEPGEKYRFEADSASVAGIFGEHISAKKFEFKVRSLEEYANLTFNLRDADSTARVELLNSSDKPVRSVAVDSRGRAEFRYLPAGTYYARMYFDADGDGRWSTGLLDSIPPEEVAYFTKKIELKSNWDVVEDWDIYAVPLDRQKPYAILKNRPKLKRGEKDPRDIQDENGDEDDFMNPMRGSSSGNRNNNNSMNNIGNLRGGFRQNNTR
ncbi:MAG: Ig-like domain-containing protein [Muribaculaceae bacterium]|nr:Ig-like domain-containing protein [Muribaculaceae bacterium]